MAGLDRRPPVTRDGSLTDVADVQYATLYLSGTTPVQAIVGSDLYDSYLAGGATLYPTHTATGPLPGLDPTDPFPQYTTAQELAAAVAGVGAGGGGKTLTVRDNGDGTMTLVAA